MENNLEQSDSQIEKAENQVQQEPVNVEMTETENEEYLLQPVQETATEVITKQNPRKKVEETRLLM